MGDGRWGFLRKQGRGREPAEADGGALKRSAAAEGLRMSGGVHERLLT